MQYAQNQQSPMFSFQDSTPGGVNSLPNPFAGATPFQPTTPFSGVGEVDYNFPTTGNPSQESKVPWQDISQWRPRDWVENIDQNFMYNDPHSNAVLHNTAGSGESMYNWLSGNRDLGRGGQR
jgi:hypothetical protein